MEKFELLTETQILNLINSMPEKTCALDPIPTDLLISCVNVLLPVIFIMVIKLVS